LGEKKNHLIWGNWDQSTDPNKGDASRLCYGQPWQTFALSE